MQRRLGQPFVVDNRLGAGGNIAAGTVERSAADGYTLLLGNLGLLIHNPLIYPKPGFEASRFVSIACLAQSTMVVKVPASSAFKTLRELVEYAKANPGKLDSGPA